MNVVIEDVSLVEKKLQVTIPGERVKRELEKAYRNLQGQVAMKGFRRGHIPRNVLEARFRSQVAGEVSNRLVSETLEGLIEENGFFIVSRPIVTPGAIDGGDFTYTAKLEIKPAVTATGYRGLALSRDVYELDEAAIDRKLEKMRREHASLDPVEEERGLVKGDVGIVDYTLSIEGKVVEGPVTDLQIEVADTDMLPGFADAVVGMNKGESREFDIDAPEKAPKAELVGKQLHFAVTLKDIKRLTLPALDDDFAKDVGADTLEALKEKERAELRAHLDGSSRAKLRDAAVDALLASHDIMLPQGLVNSQVDAMVEERKRALKRQGLKDVADTLAEAERSTMVVEAERQLRASLLLESIVDQEKIEASSDDINARLAEIAKSSGQRVEAVRGYYVKNKMMDDLVVRITHEKALELLVDSAQLTDISRPFDAHAADHQH